jgi:hypothetical protein
LFLPCDSWCEDIIQNGDSLYVHVQCSY